MSHIEWESWESRTEYELEGTYPWLPKGTRSISVERDDSYRLIARLHGVPEGPMALDKKGQPGERVEVHELKGRDTMKRLYVIEGAHVRGYSTTMRNTPRGPETTLEGRLGLNSIERRGSEKATSTLIEWYINGPGRAIDWPRSTSRVGESKHERQRRGIDGEPVAFHGGRGEEHAHDFFFIDTPKAKLIVSKVPRAYGPDWSDNVAFEYRHEWGIPGDETHTAIEELVSFILGKHLLSVGQTELSAEGYLLREYATSPWGSGIRDRCARPALPPISLGDLLRSQVESAVNALLPPYLERRAELDLSHALWMYWIASELPLGSDLPIYASAIEGISKAWFGSKRTKTGGVYIPKKDFDARLAPLLPELEKALSGVSTADRILRRIAGAYNMGANERMETFFSAAELDLPIGSAEHSAMQARNKFAHGGSTKTPDSLAEAWRASKVYATLFNRVFLRALGWAGTYTDRATVGWPERDLQAPTTGS